MKRVCIEHGSFRRLWSYQDAWYWLLRSCYARTTQSNQRLLCYENLG